MRTLFSGISRGTERLVFEGGIGQSEWERMRCPMQEGAFPFPVKYGYCATGVVEDGPAELVGRHGVLPASAPGFLQRCRLPPLRRCRTTCRRAGPLWPPTWRPRSTPLWDSGAGAGDRIVVVGAGVVGLLVASLAARLPGAVVTAVDTDESRRPVVEALGAGFARPEHAPADADVVFHASATAPGLNTAIACAGFEATIVEMSWYGSKPVQVDLGGAFHSRRLKLVSSQVGMVSPGRRAALDLPPPPGGGAAAARRTGARCAGGGGDRLRRCAPAPAADPCTGRARSCPSYPLPERLTHLETPMYAVEVRDRIMIAHSLPDPFFGPAQKMHGATFVVDVAFFRETLTKQNVVVDIGAALDVLNKTLKPLAYQNLDELPQFKGKLTTTEFLCRHVFDAMAKAAKDGALGDDGKGLAKIRVTLHETDLARAWFEGAV